MQVEANVVVNVVAPSKRWQVLEEDAEEEGVTCLCSILVLLHILRWQGIPEGHQ